jgi:outer membrane protein assembly factor BamA
VSTAATTAAPPAGGEAGDAGEIAAAEAAGTETAVAEGEVTEGEVTEGEVDEGAAAGAEIAEAMQPPPEEEAIQIVEEEIFAANFGAGDFEEGPLAEEDLDGGDPEVVDIDYQPDAPSGDDYRIRDYKIKFSPDVVMGGGGFASGLGVAAQLAIGFSDVLGNHHIQFSANVVGNLSDSDLFITYMNLKNRINWGVTLFQYRNDYLSFQDNAVLRLDREKYRGVEVFVQRPFSKFRRIELSMQSVIVNRTDSGSDDPLDSSLGIDFDGTRRFIRPEVALVTDNVLYGSTGPISGARTRLSVARSLGDLDFTTALFDLRKYINMRQRYVLAFRLMGASSFGETPQTFRVGGAYTVRGYDFEEFRGTNIGVLNAEFRFPLIEQLRFGWPLPLEFRGIRGNVFFDAGTGFNRVDGWQPFSSDGLFTLNQIKASYGFGARLNLGFLIMRFDIAQKTDMNSNIGSAVTTFSIGGDF